MNQDGASGSRWMPAAAQRTVVTIAATVAYLGLAVLGWGGLAAFFAHPARIALAIVLCAWPEPRCSPAAT